MERNNNLYTKFTKSVSYALWFTHLFYIVLVGPCDEYFEKTAIYECVGCFLGLNSSECSMVFKSRDGNQIRVIIHLKVSQMNLSWEEIWPLGHCTLDVFWFYYRERSFIPLFQSPLVIEFRLENYVTMYHNWRLSLDIDHFLLDKVRRNKNDWIEANIVSNFTILLTNSELCTTN